MKTPSFEAIERLAKALRVQPYELFLPQRMTAKQENRDLRLIIRESERRGAPAFKRFVADVLAAAQNFQQTTP